VAGRKRGLGYPSGSLRGLRVRASVYRRLVAPDVILCVFWELEGGSRTGWNDRVRLRRGVDRIQGVRMRGGGLMRRGLSRSRSGSRWSRRDRILLCGGQRNRKRVEYRRNRRLGRGLSPGCEIEESRNLVTGFNLDHFYKCISPR
jgi:hypothetical protein